MKEQSGYWTIETVDLNVMGISPHGLLGEAKSSSERGSFLRE